MIINFARKLRRRRIAEDLNKDLQDCSVSAFYIRTERAIETRDARELVFRNRHREFGFQKTIEVIRFPAMQVKREMHRYKHGRAGSGEGGRGVKSRAQAIAIGLSPSGRLPHARNGGALDKFGRLATQAIG